MKSLRSVDARVGVIVILLSIVVAVASLSFPPVKGGMSGPATFPLFLSVAGGLLGLGLLVAGVRNVNGQVMVRDDCNPTVPYWRIPMVVATIALYLLVLPRFGFVTSSALLFWMVMRFLGYPHKARAMAVSLVVAFVVYGIFSGVMNVPLPTGWLG